MEGLEHYIGEIMMGLAGTFLAGGISAYKSLLNRIKKLEEKQIAHDGRITMNEKLDEMRDKK